jgi:hypothetical protein
VAAIFLKTKARQTLTVKMRTAKLSLQDAQSVHVATVHAATGRMAAVSEGLGAVAEVVGAARAGEEAVIAADLREHRSKGLLSGDRWDTDTFPARGGPPHCVKCSRPTNCVSGQSPFPNLLKNFA